MRSTLCIVIVILIGSLSAHLAEGASSQSDAYFVVNVVDESGTFPGESTLNIVIASHGVDISTTRSRISVPNEKIPVTLDILPEDPTIILWASKAGYENSTMFTFAFEPESPQSGLLFEHTFVLLGAGASNFDNEKIFTVTIDNTSYQIATETEGSIESLTLDANNSIIVQLSGESEINHLGLDVPKPLMSGTFTVYLDDTPIARILEGAPDTATFMMKERETSSHIDVYFGPGEQQVTITATQVIPEFPINMWIAIAASVLVIAVAGPMMRNMLSRKFGSH